jgi:thymidylate synthase (FAD)
LYTNHNIIQNSFFEYGISDNIDEHIFYTFKINGISRACLQEVVRHQHLISYSVKSSRYTLKELKEEPPFTWLYGREALYDRVSKYIVLTDNMSVNNASAHNLENLRKLIRVGISNDKAKYALPDCYKTELTMTINSRSLKNFLKLRTDKAALWEIRNLAYELYNNIIPDQQYQFIDVLYNEYDLEDEEPAKIIEEK